MSEFESKTELVSANMGGNLHTVRDSINKMGLADYVLLMDYSGGSTVVLFRVPKAKAKAVRKYFGYTD